MRKYTQKELRHMVSIGTARQITNPESIPANYKKIGVSSGVYGMNGGLIQDTQSGEFFAIIGRSSLLFMIY